MKPGAPLRFLGFVLIGWVGLRIGVHVPAWINKPEPTGGVSSQPSMPGEPGPDRPAEASRTASPVTKHPFIPYAARRPARSPELAIAARPPLAVQQGQVSGPFHAPAMDRRQSTASAHARPSAIPGVVAVIGASERRAESRWSGSAWLLLRREEGAPTLAPGGTLSGSQAGMRVHYRLNGDPRRPLALSARAYLPLRRTEGAEAALGLDWRPSARLPIHLLAERRQAIGGQGRSAVALTFHGGHSAALGRLRIDAYGQAGIVGLRSRDLFADGSLRVGIPVGPMEAGAGFWGAAQPGAARVDAGPQISVPLRAGRANLRLAAEYRFRLAGDAAPASGPVLTLGAGF